MNRRNSGWVSLMVVTGATLLVAFGLITLVGSNLMVAASSFLRGIFGSSYAMGEVLVRATPLMLAALGVSIGFKTGFTNLGAEGQLYMGAIAITATALVFPGLPPIVMIPLVILVGFAAGGAWALVPGFLKARFSISEVIMTIMLNYVAINLVGILVRTSLKDPAYPYPMSPILPESANFMQLLPPTRIHAGLVMALLMVTAVHLLVFRSRLGFEMRAVGLNGRACLCSGIQVNRATILSAIAGGGLAGLAGVSEIAGLHHRLIEGISPGFGYVAIIVALLGKNHPVGIVFASIGIATLQIGSMAMQRTAGVPTSIASIVMGALILFLVIRDSRQSIAILEGV